MLFERRHHISFRSAEDGTLSGNTIAQGSVDSYHAIFNNTKLKNRQIANMIANFQAESITPG